jgi:hypothetical protein
MMASNVEYDIIPTIPTNKHKNNDKTFFLLNEDNAIPQANARRKVCHIPLYQMREYSQMANRSSTNVDARMTISAFFIGKDPFYKSKSA